MTTGKTIALTSFIIHYFKNKQNSCLKNCFNTCYESQSLDLLNPFFPHKSSWLILPALQHPLCWVLFVSRYFFNLHLSPLMSWVPICEASNAGSFPYLSLATNPSTFLSLAPVRGCSTPTPCPCYRERLGDKLRKCSSCLLSNAMFIADSSHLTSGFLFLQHLLCPVNCQALDKSPETPPEPSFMLVILFALHFQPLPDLCSTCGRLTPPVHISLGPHWELSSWVQPMAVWWWA